MDQEAANAMMENVKLYAAYDQREQTCETLVKQQKQSYESLMRVRIEREVVAATSLMHEQSAALLTDEKDFQLA